MVMHPEYSIIIPAYNEAKSLERAVRRLNSFCLAENKAFEILIVENGSKDETWKCARELDSDLDSVRAIQSAPGKGRAIQEGWKHAYSPFMLFIDADLSPSLNTLPRLLESIKRTQGCAVADRFHKDSVVDRSWPRELSSRAWATIASTLLPSPFMDFQCGAKALHKKHLADFLDSNPCKDWFFDTELIFFLQNKKVPIERISTEWIEFRFPDRVSTLSFIKTAPKFLLRLLQLRLSHRYHRQRDL